MVDSFSECNENIDNSTANLSNRHISQCTQNDNKLNVKNRKQMQENNSRNSSIDLNQSDECCLQASRSTIMATNIHLNRNGTSKNLFSFLIHFKYENFGFS